MTLLSWSNACAVGVQAMDDQHGILMDTINELHQGLVRECDRDQLDEHLERLIEFSRMHFQCEEQLLERHGYPGLKAHQLAHKNLLRRIREIVDRVENNKGVEVHSLLDFLRVWYGEHIAGPDRQYGKWLNEHGIF